MIRNFKTFPTANGFGSRVQGGEYGAVYWISDLNNSGSNSVRQAFREERYPRLIIPRVAGYVHLSTPVNVDGNNPPGNNASGNFTYLGMLAPGDGLVLRRSELRLQNVSNFVMRGMKCRAGDENGLLNEGDCLSVVRSSSSPLGVIPKDWIIDSSSFAWGTDEIVSVVGENCTIQYSIIAEALHDSIHEKGRHGYAGLWGSKNASFHHNFIGFCFERQMLFTNSSNVTEPLIDFRNNAIAYWDSRASHMGDNARINLIKNQFTAKNDGETHYYSDPVRFFTFGTNSLDNIQTIYPFGNKSTLLPSMTDDVVSQSQGVGGTTSTNTNNWKSTVIVNTELPIPVGTYDFDETVEQSNAKIAAKAGFHKRDILDSRYINQWQNGKESITSSGSKTGFIGLIDTPDDVGGFPVLDTSSDPILTGDAPHYLPTWFIDKYGLNPTLDYISAGDPSTAPWRFIFFVDNIAYNYKSTSEFPSGFAWQNEKHLNVYHCLGCEVTDEIVLWTGGEIEEPSTQFTLTLSKNITEGGAITRNPATGDITQATSVTLTAPEIAGFNFQSWKRVNADNSLTFLSTNQVYTFSMPNSDIHYRAVYISSAPPPTGKKLKMRKPN